MVKKTFDPVEEQILVDRIKYSCYLMPSESHRRQRDGTVVNEKDL